MEDGSTAAPAKRRRRHVLPGEFAHDVYPIRYLSIPAASSYSGFSPRTLSDKRFRARSGLDRVAIKRGHRILIDIVALEEWIRSRPS